MLKAMMNPTENDSTEIEKSEEADVIRVRKNRRLVSSGKIDVKRSEKPTSGGRKIST